jgi:hypothetical protein
MSDVTETPGGSSDAGSTGGTGETSSIPEPLTVEQIEQSVDGHDGVTGETTAGKGKQTSAAGDTTTTPPVKPAPKPSDPPEAGTGGGQVTEEFEQLPGWAQKRIRALEKENGDNRVKAKTAEDKADERVKANADKLQGFVDGFAKVMGLVDDTDEQAEPQRPKTIDEAMQRLEQTQGAVQDWTDKHRELQVQLAVWQSATGQGANTPELMDSAGFLAKIKGLDPAADGFAEQLAELIRAQVSSNPTRFKVQPPAAAPKQSGGEFTGGPGGRVTDADMSIEDHIRQIDPVSAAVQR